MKTRCINCDAHIHMNLCIDLLFQPPQKLCERCSSRFKMEKIERCPKCHKRLAANETVCIDCKFLERFNITIDKIHIISDYNPFVKSMLLKYKGFYDFVLCEAFAEVLLHHYKPRFFRQFDYVIAMPVSEERLNVRGFNQIEAILNAANIKHHDILKTHYRDKQSYLTKKERLQQRNPFYMSGEIKENARILLIDDIYTTGLTVYQAASVLLSNKDCSVEVLAFARA